jgi:PAS domain S-box-containing protein
MATILVVEDRPLNRKFLATLLKTAGHDVLEAGDGVEGLSVAERMRPDLVISDILMPTIDGYQLVRRMREIPTLARTPVLFYTASYHEGEARALAEQCGVSDILTKPSDINEILVKIQSVLARGKSPAPPPPDPAQFTRDHLEVVSSALASRTEAFEASEHRMAALVDVAREIAGERDPNALLNKVCDAAREVTLAQQAIITLLSDDESELRMVATSGANGHAGPPRVPLETSGFAPVIREGRALRLSHEGEILVVPIATARHVYGCLELRSKLGANVFTAIDEEVARTLGTQAGIAYENVRLYEDLRNHTVALEQEVVDRRRAELALRESEARTQFALGVAAVGIWELDLTTAKMAWSDTLAPIFGLKPVQSPRTFQGFLDVIHADDRVAVQQAFERAAHEKSELAHEFRAVWPDGGVRWIAGRARVLRDERNIPRRVTGIAMDISERKSLEEQFRQAQKMEAIGQLAGGVAHDFNNLLTAIRGYADLLLESVSHADHRRADLDEIVKAADRAASLTRQLLAFSRQQVLQPALLDVNVLVTDMSKMLRRLIGEDIELATTLVPSGAPVYADAGQLEQILMNLVVNARDAMPGGGRLSVEIANVTLDDNYVMHHSVVRPGEFVMLAVSDNGIGMDAGTRRRIFEPFFTTKERGRGTGLGLATVYGIVKQSDGYIWVYSEPQLGTTFKVYLPRAESTVHVESRPETRQTPGGSETVLLVEDEDSVRFLSRKLLERAGYRVFDAADPEQAVDTFAQHRGVIDLLVSDVIMPGSSGPALYDRLSSLDPDLHVLYMSGYTADAVAHHAAVVANAVFLQKPFTADTLLLKVREALDR